MYDASVAGPGNASKDFIEIQTVVQAVIVLFTVFVRHWPRALSVKVALKVSPRSSLSVRSGYSSGYRICIRLDADAGVAISVFLFMN